MSITPVSAYGTAKWIVSATAGQGTHTTIAAALTAASSGDTIFIRPGTYTENLTLKAGVNLTAYVCDAATPNVTISGKCSFTVAGTVSISGIRLQTNSDFLLAVTGSAASTVQLFNCYLNCTNNTGISLTSTGGALIACFETNGDLGTTGIALFANSGNGAAIRFWGCLITNGGGSSTASTISGTGAGFYPNFCSFSLPFSTSGTGMIQGAWNTFDSSGTNTTALTYNGTNAQAGSLASCTFSSGSASAISVGAGANLYITGASNVKSSNTNAITGAGTISYSLITYTSTSSTNNASVQTALPTQPAASSNFQSMTVQTFASSGTYTPTAGMLYCTIECWGPGGGGGGGASNSSQFNNGGGGGAGGYSRKTVSAATIGSSQTVTVGTKGTGGASGNNPGNNGSGATSVGSICIANAGQGGSGTSGGANANGGAGGTAGTGDIATAGQAGGQGISCITQATTTGVSGFGGSTSIGGGASGTGNADGIAGGGKGSGGGGGSSKTGPGAAAGGNGTDGFVVITEFV